MIDGGSYRDCGCDRPQLVDNVGEIGGEPHSRVGQQGGDANHVDLRLPTIGNAGDAPPRKLFRPLASE
jgi:hypothetical protein